jgi:hypothetical protein
MSDYDNEIFDYAEKQGVEKADVHLTVQDIADLKEFYRWRKYPEEKPKEPGVYMSIIDIRGYTEFDRVEWDGEKWSEDEVNDWIGVEVKNVVMWTNLPPLPEDK